MKHQFRGKKTKYSSNVYVAFAARVKLEEIVTEIGYKQRKVMAVSAFIRYLIEHYSEQAKNKILCNT